MSDLPDDVRRWPSDPFKLLGVPRNVAPLELKRAYTRLIRAYKPEHAPEEFRRIRQAYEAARQIIELRSAFRQDPPPTSYEFERAAEADISREPNEAAAPRRAPRVKSFEEQFDDCWQWAVDGDELKAYRVLEQLHAQAPHDSRIAVRLYWLLTLSPQIDPARSPCDWLVAGLRRNGFTGPLRELYRRELAANSTEAFSKRCDEMIAAIAPSSGLAELVEWRWKALPWTEQAANSIRADLETLRERFLAHDEIKWAYLLFSVVDRFAFIDAPVARDLIQRCNRDLRSLTHLHLRLAAAFDRCDLALEFSAKVRILRHEVNGQEEFLNFMSRAWSSRNEDLRRPFVSYFAALAAVPKVALRRFDAVNELASPLLFEFRRTLHSLDSMSEPLAETRSNDEINDLVLSFAHDTPSTKYSEWRHPLVDFCLGEMVMPEQLAAVLQNRRDFQLTAEQHLSQAVIADVPLMCVCHACRLFWSD